MKLAIVCARLEPEADGVGDYCRCLAEELRLHRNEVFLIGLADHPLDSPRIDSGILRLPRALPIEERVRIAREHLEKFNPDWISFQFVPYAFHPKGLVYGLGAALKPLIQGYRLHFMFHETWIGFEISSSRKEHWMGMLQRFFVRRLIRDLRPDLIHTSNTGYQWLLASQGIQVGTALRSSPGRGEAKGARIPKSPGEQLGPQELGRGEDGCGEPSLPGGILPLFGNVSFDSSGEDWRNENARHDSKKQVVFGIFGNLPVQFNVKNFCSELLHLVQPSGKSIAIWTIGRVGEEARARLDEVARENQRLEIRHFGRQPAAHVSAFLQEIDWGVATTPSNILGKSGAVAAMIEHGLPVIVFRDLEKIRGMTLEKPSHPRMFFPHHDLRSRFYELMKIPPASSRAKIAATLTQSLKQSMAEN
jgi:hypothetical protein